MFKDRNTVYLLENDEERSGDIEATSRQTTLAIIGLGKEADFILSQCKDTEGFKKQGSGEEACACDIEATVVDEMPKEETKGENLGKYLTVQAAKQRERSRRWDGKHSNANHIPQERRKFQKGGSGAMKSSVK